MPGPPDSAEIAAWPKHILAGVLWKGKSEDPIATRSGGGGTRYGLASLAAEEPSTFTSWSEVDLQVTIFLVACCSGASDVGRELSPSP